MHDCSDNQQQPYVKQPHFGWFMWLSLFEADEVPTFDGSDVADV